MQGNLPSGVSTGVGIETGEKSVLIGQDEKFVTHTDLLASNFAPVLECS